MPIQVDEFLRTCRLHHRTLVVVCVTALLFGLTPLDTRRLNQAIEEAELLSNVDFANLLNEATRGHDEAKPYIDKITATLSSLEIGYVGSAYQVLFGNIYSIPRADATIDTLRRYILKGQSANFPIPQVDDLWFDRIKQSLIDQGLHNKQLTRLKYNAEGVRLRSPGGVTNTVALKSWGSKKIKVQADLVKVIQRDSKNGKLIQARKGNNPIVFPYLQAFWQEVRDLAPREAVAYLVNRKTNTTENITSLGVSIPANLAIFTVPLATFFLALFLYLYIMKLVELVKSVEDVNTEEQIFPWLAIFKGWKSQTLTFFSNPVLPLLANVIIIRRSWHSSSFFVILLAIILTLLTMFLGFRSYYELTGKLCQVFHAPAAKR